MDDPRRLERECAVLARYLIGEDPGAPVQEGYRRAHELGAIGAGDSFDGLLVGIARGGGFLTRVADGHARLLAPSGTLRRKLVLVLALLESDARGHASVDRIGPGSAGGLLLAMAGWIAMSALALLAGALLLVPLGLAAALRRGRSA